MDINSLKNFKIGKIEILSLFGNKNEQNKFQRPLKRMKTSTFVNANFNFKGMNLK